MTTGLLEGITGAIGQQINELGGMRSTRIEVGHDAVKGDTFIQVETTFGWNSSGYFYAEGYLHQYTGVAPGLYPARLTGITYFDGVTYLPGIGTDLESRTEILDYTRVYSAVDKMRASFLVDYALGSDLDTLARNIGVFREPELSTSDAIYREVVKAIAYSPRGTMYVIELYLDALFGAGNYRIFEDMTNSGYASRLGSTTVNNPGQIFITRQLTESTTSAGKAFIESPLRGEIQSIVPGATVGDFYFEGAYPYNHTPAVQGCTLLDEGGPRVVVDPVRDPNFEGTMTGFYDPAIDTAIQIDFTQPVPSSASNVIEYAQVGDTLLIGTNPYPTTTGIIDGPDSLRVIGTVISVTPIFGGGQMEVGTTGNAVGTFTPFADDFSTTTWMLLREKTLCDTYFPSGDKVTEGVPSGFAVQPFPKRAWTYDSVSGNLESAVVSRGGGLFPGGYGTVITLNAGGTPGAGGDAKYRQEARVLPDSYATFEAALSFRGTLDATSVDQVYMELMDGDTFNAVPGKHLRLGVREIALGPTVEVAFSDALGSFISGATPFTANVGDEHVYKLIKDGQERAYFYVDDVLIDSIAYSSLTTASTVDQHRTIDLTGNGAIGKSVEFDSASSTLLEGPLGSVGGNLASTTPFTFSTWFQTSTNANQTIAVQVANDAMSVVGIDFALSMTAGGVVGATLFDNVGVPVFANGVNSYTDGVWHLAVVSWDGSALELWIDPGSATSDSGTTAIGTRRGSAHVPPQASLSFGGNSTYLIPGNHFTGYVDESAYWDTAFSLAEATELFANRHSMDLATHSQSANLVSWWRMGEGDSGGTPDSTDSADPTARIYDMGPGGFNIDLEPKGMTSSNISTTVALSASTGAFWQPSVRIGWLDWSSQNPTDLTNIRVRDASNPAGTAEVMDDLSENILGSVPTDAIVRITTAFSSLDNYPGDPRGEFEVSSNISANKLELRGILREENATVVARASGGVVVYDRIRLGATSREPFTLEADEPYAFTFPQDLGKKVRLYTGAAYEERTITKILDPISGDSIGPTFGIDESVVPNALTTLDKKGSRSSIPSIGSNYCEVDISFPGAYSNATWSLEPTFNAAGDAGIVFEVVQQGNYVGFAGFTESTLTVPFGPASKVGAYHKPLEYIGDGEPRVALLRTNAISAQILDPDRVNAQTSPPAYDYYPFYLTGDSLGSAINTLQKVLTAAGVQVNLRIYEYDSNTGDHII